jgi:ABC-2 type transport system ATP-binding protein
MSRWNHVVAALLAALAARHACAMTTGKEAGGGVVLSRLRKSYGRVQAVRSVDLVITPGETVALLGPNGAGKSTIIDMVLGLAGPDSGYVSLFGKSPRAAAAAGLIGGMLQTGSLVDYLSVRELLTMIASLYPRPLEVDRVLRLTGVEDFADRKTNRLSGGQTQRVRFAGVLAANPELLVLDEPTTAIDVEGRRQFWAAMREVAAEGKTVLFATHYLEEADAYADRIVLMAQGQIVADGPATEIKAMVSGRTIRATLPGAGIAALAVLPGVTRAELRGEAVILSCSDSDAALRALLSRFPGARDIEVRGAGIEEAFLALTAQGAQGDGSRTMTLSKVAMATLGTMASAVSSASVISAERSCGWTRQMRITPLRAVSYFGAKVLNGYLRALLTLMVLGLAGTLFGVRLPAHEWLTVLGLLLAGLAPFTVLGILLGHVISSDASAPAVGGIVTVFALLGGVYGFQVARSGAMLQFLKALPSYWLVQADKTTTGGGAWPAEAWIVIAARTAALSLGAVLVYQRDTSRT